MQRLLLASDNPGKLREFQQLLAPLAWEVLPQSEFQVQEAPEPHNTFVENAIAKARNCARQTGQMSLADDSGICVPALHHAPGVLSARYAGEPKSDIRNNAKLLAMLRDQNDRRAYYVCVLVLLRSAEEPQPLIAEGAWHGTIIDEPRGQNGFGYDPYFYVPELALTAAELPAAEKNAISHRGVAIRVLVEKLRTIGILNALTE